LAKTDEFAVRGLVIRRNNFDGSAVTTTRMLSTVGPWDLSVQLGGQTILDAGKAPIVIRATRQSGTTQERKVLDFTVGVADITAVQPAEFIQRFNAAGFSNVTAVLDNATGAVNVRTSDGSIQFLQIFGLLAGAVGFGGCRPFRGYGSILWNYVTHDDAITVTPTLQKSDDTTVDQAGGRLGTLSRIIVPGKVTGVQYAVNTKPKDNVIRQMLEGGSWVVGVAGMPDKYTRPTATDDPGNLSCEWWVLYPQYKANTQSTVTEYTKMNLDHVYKGTGSVGDASRGASTLANFNYTLDCAAEYVGIDGGTYSQPEELEYPTLLWQQFKLLEAAADWNLADLTIIPVTDFIFTTPMSLVAGQTGYDVVNIVPGNASGFTVSFATPAVLTDTVFTWEEGLKRVRVVAGSVTGTENIAVTFTNDDGSTIVKALPVTVYPA